MTPTTSSGRDRLLFAQRPQWSADAAIGKTIVSSSIIDRVAKKTEPQAGGDAGRV